MATAPDSGGAATDPAAMPWTRGQGLPGVRGTAVTFSFSKSLKSARITAASRDLVAALRYTRGQAIVKGQQEVLILNLDDNSYTAPGKSAVKLPSDMHLQLTTAEQEVTGGNSGGIRFFAVGSSTGGHISVLQDRREWRVNVNWLTGQVTREEVAAH